jgi:hypothetical protein
MNTYNQLTNATQNLKTSIYSDYGQDWLVNDAKTLGELGDNALKLRYLEKSLKSKRRIEQRQDQKVLDVDEELNQKYKYDKNAVVGRKFPYKADEFKYPNDNNEKPKSLYVKYSNEYGSKKPNDLELPGMRFFNLDKFFPINNTFTNDFTYMYKNNSLNTAENRSKVHSSLDSVI